MFNRGKLGFEHMLPVVHLTGVQDQKDKCAVDSSWKQGQGKNILISSSSDESGKEEDDPTSNM